LVSRLYAMLGGGSSAFKRNAAPSPTCIRVAAHDSGAHVQKLVYGIVADRKSLRCRQHEALTTASKHGVHWEPRRTGLQARIPTRRIAPLGPGAGDRMHGARHASLDDGPCAAAPGRRSRGLIAAEPSSTTTSPIAP